MTERASTTRPHPNRAVTRRTLARNAAWSVPLIAAAAPAPAFAASPCDPPTGSTGAATYTFATTTQTSGSGSATTSSTYSRASSTSATATSSDPDGAATTYAPVTLGITAALVAGSTNLSINNFNLVPYYSGNVVGFALSQQQVTATNTNRATNGQAITFAFTRNGNPVTLYNLSFTMADITSANTNGNNTYWDSFEITGAAFSLANGAQVIGAGTAANRLRAASGNTDPTYGDLPASSSVITFASVSSFTLRYFSESTVVSSANNNAPGFQGVTIGPFSFNMKPTACP